MNEKSVSGGIAGVKYEGDCDAGNYLKNAAWK
jgi:hypothetical protein